MEQRLKNLWSNNASANATATATAGTTTKVP